MKKRMRARGRTRENESVGEGGFVRARERGFELRRRDREGTARCQVGVRGMIFEVNKRDRQRERENAFMMSE